MTGALEPESVCLDIQSVRVIVKSDRRESCITADARDVKHWHFEVPQHGLCAGLVWGDDQNDRIDASRLRPHLATLTPIENVVKDAIEFVSVQKGVGEDDARAWPARWVCGPGCLMNNNGSFCGRMAGFPRSGFSVSIALGDGVARSITSQGP